jgi:hypothetical protein
VELGVEAFRDRVSDLGLKLDALGVSRERMLAQRLPERSAI